jgi:ribosomal protein S12 methylthiotransferase accessory factor
MLFISLVLKASGVSRTKFAQNPLKRWLSERCINFSEFLIQEKLLVSIGDSSPFDSINPSKLFKPLSKIVDLRSVGLVGEIIKLGQLYPDEPKIHSFRITGTENLWGSGHGVDFFDEEKAMWRAVGEFTERFLWRHYIFYKKTVRGSYSELKNKALNIHSLAGFDESQITKSPVLSYTDETSFLWTHIHSLTSNKRLLCPVQLVSNFYSRNNVKSPHKSECENSICEPMLRWCITTGLATGGSKRDALISGMLEVIERDAFMLTYLSKISPDKIDIQWLASQDQEISEILKQFSRNHITPHILLLPTDFDVYVVTIVLQDKLKTGPAIAVAASAGFNLRETIIDGLSEAVAVRLFLRTALDKGLTYDSDKIDQEGRLLYWSDHRNSRKLTSFLAGSIVQPESLKSQNQQIDTQRSTSNRYSRREYSHLISEFKKLDQPVFFVELTSPDVKKNGLRVIKIIAPEMHPLHLHENLPYLSSKRLSGVLKKRSSQTDVSLETAPHPFP